MDKSEAEKEILKIASKYEEETGNDPKEILYNIYRSYENLKR